MWHETAEEMRALLTSVFKVDKDLCEMSILLIFLKVDYEQALPKNKENFKWEIHVLFDDAINCNFQTSEIVPNEFLRTFCDEMESMIATYDIEHKAEVVQRFFRSARTSCTIFGWSTFPCARISSALSSPPSSPLTPFPSSPPSVLSSLVTPVTLVCPHNPNYCCCCCHRERPASCK